MITILKSDKKAFEAISWLLKAMPPKSKRVPSRDTMFYDLGCIKRLPLCGDQYWAATDSYRVHVLHVADIPMLVANCYRIIEHTAQRITLAKAEDVLFPPITSALFTPTEYAISADAGHNLTADVLLYWLNRGDLASSSTRVTWRSVYLEDALSIPSNDWHIGWDGNAKGGKPQLLLRASQDADLVVRMAAIMPVHLPNSLPIITNVSDSEEAPNID